MIQRVVIDTNVFVEPVCTGSQVQTPGQAVLKAQSRGHNALASAATWVELNVVLRRAKFARYIRGGNLRQPYLEKIRSFAAFIETPSPIRACRDPKDDKFLELAVDGRANAIVTRDNDLLALHPFRGIPILTPADYLNLK